MTLSAARAGAAPVAPSAATTAVVVRSRAAARRVIKLLVICLVSLTVD
jgi:hypothetical protein